MPDAEPARDPRIDRMLDPGAIAVVGASNNPGKRGHHAVRELLAGGYPHPVYPVNPGEREVLGLPAYPSVSAIGAPVDLAFVVTPAGSLPAVLADCGKAGVAGAVAVAVGFAETGEDGERCQAEAVAAARQHGVRLLGPNTSGIFHLLAGVNLVGLPDVPRGPIGMLSQSGNLLLSVVTAARRAGGRGSGGAGTPGGAGGLGLSRYAGVGNEADVGYPELFDHFADAADVRAICCYAEGFRRGRETLAAVSRAAARKPVVIFKAGRTVEGGRSARSHTGAVAGDAAVAAAALRTAGAVLVAREDELLPVTAAAAAWPAAGGRVAILADGGGHATITTDAVAGAPRLRLAELSAATRRRLRELLGRHAAVGNPVDVAGATDTDPARFAEAAGALLADPGVDQLVVVGLLGGYAQRFDSALREPERRACAALAELAGRAKPVLVSSVYAGADGETLAPLAEAGIPVLSSVEVTVRCAAALAERAAWLGTGPPSWPALTDVPAGEPRLLTEPAARELLGSGGVPTGAHRHARTAAQAAAAAAELGGRVALKVVSADLTHKSDVGGVRLDVPPEAAAGAYEQLLAGVRRARPAASLDGVLVTPMATGRGPELLVGVSRDATFGPVLTVGAGGTLVELLGDVAIRPLPVTADQIRAMLAELRVARLLDGYRGAPPADLDALVALVAAVGEFVLAHPEVRELDLNPVLAHPGGATVLDARVFTT